MPSVGGLYHSYIYLLKGNLSKGDKYFLLGWTNSAGLFVRMWRSSAAEEAGQQVSSKRVDHRVVALATAKGRSKGCTRVLGREVWASTHQKTSVYLSSIYLFLQMFSMGDEVAGFFVFVYVF